jgi:replicative DNA helicase
MGKTALALQLAATAGYTYGKTVLFFSLEMSTGQLVGRLLASASGVELRRLRDPQVELVNQEMQRLGNAFGQLAETTLLIDDSPEITVSSLRSRVRRIQMGRPIDMIVVDHLQMLVPGGGSRNRNQEVEEAARQLKALAREMNIPVIVLSQLSRATEAGSDKRPSLSNLRDSGGIEQYADVVILLYREEYYQPDTARQGAADLIIAKHRNGASGQVTLLFTQRTTNFTDLEAVYSVVGGNNA